jgi:Na+-transporting NADH:ubiquinone oxidoreductase subunit NqrC
MVLVLHLVCIVLLSKLYVVLMAAATLQHAPLQQYQVAPG